MHVEGLVTCSLSLSLSFLSPAPLSPPLLTHSPLSLSPLSLASLTLPHPNATDLNGLLGLDQLVLLSRLGPLRRYLIPG